MPNPYRGTIEERFWGKVEKTDDCWNWIAGKFDAGYGQFYDKDYPPFNHHAHRWLYERTVGVVPEGLELDHLCRNRACVRPDHLEPVPHRVNVLRSPLNPGARTECVNGHPFDEANTKYRRDGRRYCWPCNQAHDKRTRARQRAERATA